MKQILIILGLFASVTTFAQSPRIKLNQITKDTVKGSVLISSPSDSGMIYSRDFYIAYGADTVLILYGDTLAATSDIISSVLSDGVTITGDGTSGNELEVDTSIIATIKALNDSLTAKANASELSNYLLTSNYIVDSTRINATGDTAYYYQNGVLIGTKALAGGGGGGYWTQNGTDLFYNSGNVGINQATPSAKLDVVGDVEFDGKLDINNGYNSIFMGTNVGINSNTSAINNTSIGHLSFEDNTSGAENTSIGMATLTNNTTGSYNTAIGSRSLQLNQTGSDNTAIGYYSLNSNVSASDNTAVGYNSMQNLTSSDRNVALGWSAGKYYGTGLSALTTAQYSTYLGASARASANSVVNETVVGYNAVGNGSNSVTIGNTSVTKTILNGDVGIDEISPSAKLDVVGSTELNGALTQSGGDANFDSGTLYVDATNNRVGIGTTSPTSPLDIRYSSGFNGLNVESNQNGVHGMVLRNNDTGTSARTGITFYNGSGAGDYFGFYINGNNYNGISGWNDRFTVQSGSGVANGLLFYSSLGGIQLSAKGFNTPDVYVQDATGNVGIGTSSPSAKLEVNGSSCFGDACATTNSDRALNLLASNAVMKVHRKTTSTAQAPAVELIWGGDSLSSSTNNVYWDFYTIGDNQSVHKGKFVLRNRSYEGNVANNINWLEIYPELGETYLQGVYDNTTTNSANVNVDANGLMRRVVSSSARYKTNINDWDENAIELIKKLKPRRYTYKKEYYNYPDKEFIGLLAEEVAEVNPYLVDYKTEGRIGLVENVRYSNIVVPLIKAIQEQQAIIETQEQKITDLENTIQSLITRIENLENK